MIKHGQIWATKDGIRYEILTWDDFLKRRPGDYSVYRQNVKYPAINLDYDGWNPYAENGQVCDHKGNSLPSSTKLVTLIKDVEDDKVSDKQKNHYKTAVEILKNIHIQVNSETYASYVEKIVKVLEKADA